MITIGIAHHKSESEGSVTIIARSDTKQTLNLNAFIYMHCHRRYYLQLNAHRNQILKQTRMAMVLYDTDLAPVFTHSFSRKPLVPCMTGHDTP